MEAKQVTLVDYFHFTKPHNQVLENFITLVQPLIEGNTVILQSSSGRCRLEFETTELQVKAVTYRDHHGQEQRAYVIQAHYLLEQQAAITVKLTLEN